MQPYSGHSLLRHLQVHQLIGKIISRLIDNGNLIWGFEVIKSIEKVAKLSTLDLTRDLSLLFPPARSTDRTRSAEKHSNGADTLNLLKYFLCLNLHRYDSLSTINIKVQFTTTPMHHILMSMCFHRRGLMGSYCHAYKYVFCDWLASILVYLKPRSVREFLEPVCFHSQPWHLTVYSLFSSLIRL